MFLKKDRPLKRMCANVYSNVCTKNTIIMTGEDNNKNRPGGEYVLYTLNTTSFFSLAQFLREEGFAPGCCLKVFKKRSSFFFYVSLFISFSLKE